MDSTDLAKMQRRARTRYELGRARRALLGVAPFLLVVAISLALTHRSSSTLLFGIAALSVGAVMLWYGRDLQRAVLPGAAAGLVPLTLALCANRFHNCGAESCASLCIPACVLGGVVAGLAVASVGNQRRAGAGFWLSASGVALLTGSMGCACVGYSGVVGLALGYTAGVVPGLMRRAFGEKAP